jgi:hypothetical protein
MALVLVTARPAARIACPGECMCYPGAYGGFRYSKAPLNGIGKAHKFPVTFVYTTSDLSIITWKGMDNKRGKKKKKIKNSCNFL